MKRILLFALAVLVMQQAHSQVIITSADMPVHGDKLVYSNADMNVASIAPGDSGTNMSWNYNLVPASQGFDEYKSAVEVSPTFAGSISILAIGYKIADSIPGLSLLPTPIPIAISDIHTFFDKVTSPRSGYMATAYAYKLNNIIPVATNYTDPDVWYFFPLTYGNATDSAHYALHLSIQSAITIDQIGSRKTRVDGWGTITTPYFTTPVECIRVRSEIREIDSISVQGFKFGVPRNMVEYKWLVNGHHYPALWVTSTLNGGTETVTTIRYKDVLDPAKVAEEKPAIYEVKAYPNPAANGITTLDLPAEFKTFTVEIFDVTGKVVATQKDKTQIDLSASAAGRYLIRVISGSKVAYAAVIR